MIGRESELALLSDRWERAKSHEGQVVLLGAEAGIGKSRITRALRQRIAQEGQRVLLYQCSSLHINSAFHAIVEQIERSARFEAQDTTAHKLKKVEALLTKAQVDLARCAGPYAAMLSLSASADLNRQLSPQQQKESYIAAHVEQVLGLATSGPLLILLEDAHWADPSTLECFGTLIEKIDDRRVMLLVTHRPEFMAPWKSASRTTVLTLTRLSARETTMLIERVSGKSLPSNVLQQILAKADGVPLFAEELTKTVVESGQLLDTDDRYAVSVCDSRNAA